MARRPRKADYQLSSDNQLRDAGNAALLFADNKHPLEYYIQQLENFDKIMYIQEDYSKGTTALLD
ncbi:uncharacterized protein BJX67DRAFT_382255 [Aspergillus lucknowensis]|uniref:Uncharacterized protein n=1 Tax=Aspergillus lucknowensis TaxID=176173 RepID=A0ABR4LPV9_9EURO